MADHVILEVPDMHDAVHTFLVVPVTITAKNEAGGLGGVVQAPVLFDITQWDGKTPISTVMNNQLPEAYKQVRVLRLAAEKGLAYTEPEDLV